ncbi:S1 family peptidase [Saccharothrix stipae]
MTLSTSARRAPAVLLAALALVLAGAPVATARTVQPPGGDTGLEIVDLPGVQADDPADGDVGTQIVGGRPASELYPAVAIEYDTDYTDPPRTAWGTCTGSVIARTWVLTAAHCLTNLPAQSRASGLWQAVDRATPHAPPLYVPTEEKHLYLKIGATDRSQADRVEIKRVVIHPGWNWVTDPTRHGADAALVELATPTTVKPFPLARQEPRPGSQVRALGWGRLSNDATSGSLELQELDTVVLPAQRCASGLITKGDVCTHNPRNKNGVCNGDSGGPVIRRVLWRWVQVGVVSRSGAQLCGITPDVHTGVTTNLPWIKAVVESTIPVDLPLTAAQGGPITHPDFPIGTTPSEAPGLYDLAPAA